jgi:hypothetical protein
MIVSRHVAWKTTALLLTLLVAWAGAAARSAHAQAPAHETPAAPQAAPTGPAAPTAPAPTAAKPATQTEATSSGSTLDAALRAALLQWGCQPADLIEHEQRWYAACGAAGVLVLEQRGTTLVLSERRPVSGRAQALFVRGDAVWVESLRLEAHPLTELAASAAPASAPRAAMPRAAAVAREPRELPPTAKPTSKLAPPRIGSLWRVEGALRPYLPMSSLGVAMLADAAVTYHGKRAWYAQARIYPLGGAITNGPDGAVFGAAGAIGYDHQFFALGLGVGTLRRGEFHSDFDPVQRRTREWTEYSFGLAVTQFARVGALDGLNFTLTNSFVLNNESWNFGYFDLTVQIPLTRQSWLVGAGGGGAEGGYLYAELGLRRLIRGDRGSGSLFVKPSVGVAGIDNRVDGVDAGPMLGCHLEWRQ